MTEQDIVIPMPDGEADATLFLPEPIFEASHPLPGVLHLPDIRGPRDANRGMARRLAAEGYTVLLPNIFYRASRPPVFPFPFEPGTPRTQQHFAALTGPLTPAAMHADAAGYLAALDANNATASPIAVVGHCFSGAQALRTAAALPTRVAAVASFHGGGLFKADDPTSPHLELPHTHATLYFAHAENDRFMPADDIAHLDDALRSWGGHFESEIYPAGHGWTVPDNGSYSQPEAERAYTKLTALLARTLR